MCRTGKSESCTASNNAPPASGLRPSCNRYAVGGTEMLSEIHGTGVYQ